MTAKKLKGVFLFYRQWMHDKGLVPILYPTGPNDGAPWDFPHLAYMCDNATEILIPSGKTDKAMRWLGFIQGVLVSRKLFTLEEVRGHSREDS